MVTVIIILTFSFFPTFLVLLHEEHIDKSWSTISSLLKYYIHYKFINSFHATGLFLYPWKHEKTSSFHIISGGIGRYHCHEMGFKIEMTMATSLKKFESNVMKFYSGAYLLSHFSPVLRFKYRNQYLFCRAKQMTGFPTKRNTGLKWVKSTFSYRVNTWFRSMLYI